MPDNLMIALAAVRQCAAKQYAALAEAHADAVVAETKHYLDDLTHISLPILQSVRTLRYDLKHAQLDARFAAGKAAVAAHAMERALAVLGQPADEGGKL